MKFLIDLHDRFFAGLTRLLEPWFLPTLARFTFAATLLVYYWNSASLKLGDGITGIFRPSAGAFGQIFPRAYEAAGYDETALSDWHWAVTILGTWAEFILPALLVLGLLTRLAALGMIGFVIVQTLTDLYGHGVIESPETLGAWFDRASDSAIMDQRLLWITVLAIPLLRGAGPISLDQLLRRRAPIPA